MPPALKPDSVQVQPLALNSDPASIAAHNASIRTAFDRRFTRPVDGVSNDRHTSAAKVAFVYDALRALSVELGYIVPSDDFTFAELPEQLRSITYPRLRHSIARLKDDVRRRKVEDMPLTLTETSFMPYLHRSVPF